MRESELRAMIRQECRKLIGGGALEQEVMKLREQVKRLKATARLAEAENLREANRLATLAEVQNEIGKWGGH